MDERQRFTGKNEEQALERAERVLGVARSGLKWTVVSQEKGFLGLGASVTIEVVIPSAPAPAAPPPLPRRKTGDVPGPARPGPGAATPDGDPAAPAPAADRGRDRDRGRSRGRGRDRDRGRGSDRGRGRGGDRGGSRGGDRDRDRDRGRPPAPRHEDRDEDDGPVDEALFAARLEKAGEVARGLLEAMGWTTAVTVERQGTNRILVKVDERGDDLAADGRDVIDAIQFLLNKIVNRFPPRYRILVDVAGMLEKFDAELTRRAEAWCRQVLESGEELRVDEELNPRDRRIVHLEVRKHPELDSRSEGDGRDRRICIFRV